MLYTGNNVVNGKPVLKEFLIDEDDPQSTFVGCDSISETYLLLKYNDKYYVISDTCPERKFNVEENDGDIGQKEIKKFFVKIDPRMFIDGGYAENYQEHLLEDIPVDIMAAFLLDVEETKRQYDMILSGNVPNSIDDEWQFVPVEMYDESIVDEMISKVDKIQIYKVFSKINGLQLKSEKNIEIVDKALKLWAINKSHLYKIFGNKLKHMKNVEVEKDDDVIVKQVQEISNKYPQYSKYLSVVSASAFKNNKIDDDCDGLMKRGAKVSRVFHQWYNNTELDLELARILDNKTATRYVWASIDPIDYLFAACTKSNFTSCLDIRDGGYKVGSLTMMYDNSSIITFATSSDDRVEIPFGDYQVKALNKCWRQIVYFNNETGSQLYARQYPTDKRNKEQHAEMYNGSRYQLESIISKAYNHSDKWKTTKFDSSLDFTMDQQNYQYCDIHNGDSEDKLVRFNETNNDADKIFKSGHIYKDRYICPTCGKNSKLAGNGSLHCKCSNKHGESVSF